MSTFFNDNLTSAIEQVIRDNHTKDELIDFLWEKTSKLDNDYMEASDMPTKVREWYQSGESFSISYDGESSFLKLDCDEWESWDPSEDDLIYDFDLAEGVCEGDLPGLLSTECLDEIAKLTAGYAIDEIRDNFEHDGFEIFRLEHKIRQWFADGTIELETVWGGDDDDIFDIIANRLKSEIKDNLEGLLGDDKYDDVIDNLENKELFELYEKEIPENYAVKGFIIDPTGIITEEEEETEEEWTISKVPFFDEYVDAVKNLHAKRKEGGYTVDENYIIPSLRDEYIEDNRMGQTCVTDKDGIVTITICFPNVWSPSWSKEFTLDLITPADVIELAKNFKK